MLRNPEKGVGEMRPQSGKAMMETRTMTALAALIAFSVVLTRFLSYAPEGPLRMSVGNMPIVLAGILFGPVGGALAGFAADVIGASVQGYGFNPLLIPTPILMGLIPGLLRPILDREATYLRFLLVSILPYIVGSIGYQSYILYTMYGGSYSIWFIYGWRAVIFIITPLVDTFIIYILFRRNVFAHIGISDITVKKKAR
ncbi:MAG: folate family ECF transporter S component [Oscillospiraceae bacterium]|jgi:ECF transporter S component (folate family)|nr:folate family ECF transporter S component [Oscillospiraceae bacterium]